MRPTPWLCKGSFLALARFSCSSIKSNPPQHCEAASFAGLQHITLSAGFQGQAFASFPVANARTQQLRSTSHSSELPTAFTPPHLSILRGGTRAHANMPSEARIVVLGAGNEDPSLSRLELLPAAAKVSPRWSYHCCWRLTSERSTTSTSTVSSKPYTLHSQL